MATITSTFSLQTSTLFPDSIVLAATATSTVNYDADYVSEIIKLNTKTTIYKSNVSKGTVYMYIKSKDTNDANIEVYVTNSAGTEIKVMTLISGDFAWFPLASDLSGATVKVLSLSKSNTASIDYFFGERGSYPTTDTVLNKLALPANPILI